MQTIQSKQSKDRLFCYDTINSLISFSLAPSHHEKHPDSNDDCTNNGANLVGTI